MWSLVFCVLSATLTPSLATFYKTNISDFSQCTVYYSTVGALYKDFFAFSAESVTDDLALDFHFSVLTQSDAHILLTPSQAQVNDSVYEIVIGAGGNTFSDIRRRVKASVKESIRIKDLLSPVDIRSFWIHITKAGVVELGREGEELAFLSWTDPDPLTIREFSFSTWRNIQAKWFFDCRRDEDIKKVERNLTQTDRLRQDLLTNYNPYVRPVKIFTDKTVVLLQLEVNALSLDEHQSIFELSGEAVLVWNDEKLRWNASNYGNLSTFHIFRREIWQPDLFLYGAVDDGRNIFKDSLMVAHSEGIVRWKTPFTMRSWCDARGKGDWPRDEHHCIILLGVLRDYPDVVLTFDRNQSIIQEKYREWTVNSVIAFYKSDLVTQTYVLQFDIVRSSDIYSTIFFTPFIVTAMCLLSIFWISPFSQLKMTLCCSHILTSAILLIGLAATIPTHPSRVPFLVLLHSYSMIGGVIATIVTVLVINISRTEHKHALPHLLTRILTSGPMKLGLLLPSTDLSEMAGKHGKLNEATNTVRSSNLQEKRCQATWILLAVTIDRLAFLTYLPIIIYGFYANFA